MKRETAREDVPRVRVRGPGARLQGRSHARAVSDRARQDSPESIVGDVRATPAPARHSDQAGAPARPAALHQGVRRLSRWRLAVGVLLFAALAPLSLVALPLAALLVAARPATRGASRAMRYVVEVAPGLYPAFEPAVRLLAAWPLWLVIESLVGLALAWRSHAVIARTPLSAAGINH